MTTKIFDCVRIKRDGAKKIYEQTADMSSDEQFLFWMKKTELFRSRLSQRGFGIDGKSVSHPELIKECSGCIEAEEDLSTNKAYFELSLGGDL